MPPASQRGIGRVSTSSVPSLPSVSSVSASGSVPASTARPVAAAASASASASTPTVDASASSPAPNQSSAPSTSSSSSATTTATSASRPSLLSRLGLPLPFRRSNRNVADFHVRCDEPHKKYTAGESVRGAVVLVVVKPLRITHLVVCLHGYVRVVKDAVAAAKSHGAAIQPVGGESDRPQYHGNGLASLFQDEQVLSGEGRMDPGKYEFGFDLVFPDKGLPSSIDFERGTISYVVTATLTRPTSIAPTLSCERKVILVDIIDVGRLSPPRPRTIFLEPISKRTRRKKSMGPDKASAIVSETNDLASEMESVAPSVTTDDVTRDGSNTDQRSTVQSEGRSEMSEESSRSISTAISRAEHGQLSQVGTKTAQQQAVDEKTITATIELLKGGCLPGDTVSVRVTVQHVKRVKSMTGVVVTLFRQGKIDSSPQAALFDDWTPKGSGRGAQREEVYPRSRTGLAGLSLTSTSSTSMFRKDLDQHMLPLIIDPSTLQASVTISVKIPDDSFPTIRGVPGEMIAFTYQVEVIVDLGGRLSSQFQGGGSSRFTSVGTASLDPQTNSSFGPWRGNNVADTTTLRKEKGVISVSMETVVGTVDSSWNRAPINTISVSQADLLEHEDDEVIRPEAGQHEDGHPFGPASANSQLSPHQVSSQRNGQHYFTSPSPTHLTPVPSSPAGLSPRSYVNTNGDAAPAYFAPPQLPDENTMSEKERIRQAETRLLPSQPPGAVASSSSAAVPDAADDDIYDAQDTPRPSIPDIRALSPADDDTGPSAPTQEELSSGSTEGPVEDKQERERRRLQHEASAPPEFPEDMEQRNGESQGTEAEPTAPVLEDEDGYPGYEAAAGPSTPRPSRPETNVRDEAEQLPAYVR